MYKLISVLSLLSIILACGKQKESEAKTNGHQAESSITDSISSVSFDDFFNAFQESLDGPISQNNYINEELRLSISKEGNEYMKEYFSEAILEKIKLAKSTDCTSFEPGLFASLGILVGGKKLNVATIPTGESPYTGVYIYIFTISDDNWELTELMAAG